MATTIDDTGDSIPGTLLAVLAIISVLLIGFFIFNQDYFTGNGRNMNVEMPKVTGPNVNPDE